MPFPVGSLAYGYIETSLIPSYSKATLEIDLSSKPSTCYCLRFAYHMYGQDMGQLEVLVIPSGHKKEESVWKYVGGSNCCNTYTYNLCTLTEHPCESVHLFCRARVLLERGADRSEQANSGDQNSSDNWHVWTKGRHGNRRC